MCGTRCFCRLLSYSVLTIPRRLSTLQSVYPLVITIFCGRRHVLTTHPSLIQVYTVVIRSLKHTINIRNKQFSVDRKWLRSITCIQANVFPFKLCQTKARKKSTNFQRRLEKGNTNKSSAAGGTHSYIYGAWLFVGGRVSCHRFSAPYIRTYTHINRQRISFWGAKVGVTCGSS